MHFKNENRHMVDVLFVLSLFCVFAFSALMLVIIGADVYKKTAAHMDTNYASRISYAYPVSYTHLNAADEYLFV